ncbi:hypothetical protein CPT_Merlin147 [Citrobacter phage Merlin]|uniref:Uncharacterized protein n=1 Tax=Citrobacter phage Merlin TaxID=1675602 RepID=A0A0K1LNM0_9CAUD|nr:hypothetical protein CPT_Merlin147 [Citrobacter phage Merlin]AKU43793.1 hypothetical protein CPT_Merlin147 [Citrobacter phage Merlin]
MKYYRPGPSYLYQDSEDGIALVLIACAIVSMISSVVVMFIWGAMHNMDSPNSETVEWMVKGFVISFIASYIFGNGERHLNNIMAARKWRKEERERLADITAKNKVNEHKQLLKFIENCKNEK